MSENVFFFLKSKAEVKYLHGKMTIKEGIDEMKLHRFTSTPVIDDGGFYLGSISQGDFLWYLYNIDDPTKLTRKTVKSIIRKDYIKAASIDTPLEELLTISLNQNYIPIVDDRNVFIGIVTRKTIIEYFLNK